MRRWTRRWALSGALAVVLSAASGATAAASIDAPPATLGPATPASKSGLPSPREAASRATRRPRVVADHVGYGAERRRQMAAYSARHYGSRTWRLRDPDAIVLHFTATDSYAAVWSTFDSNAPNLGESPGVCAHYVIKRSGKIAELVSPRIRCRHTIGLNHRSIGIEIVQRTGRGSHWADRQILERRPQVRAALRLVRRLQARYAIRTGDVIGHAMANESRYFKDLEGWRNDHSDWLKRDVRFFRKRLRRLGEQGAG